MTLTLIPNIDREIGMSEEIRGGLFDVGKNISRVGTDGEKGTGFGMPMVKKFVMAYGGTIEVQSTSDTTSPSRGTVVLIVLKDAQPSAIGPSQTLPEKG